MDHVTLGRSGLRVSRMGLGCGGHSRLGKRTGRTEDESIAIVRRALELGINFIDTAESYETEEIVGKGIRGRDRTRIVLSTKKSLTTRRGTPDESPITPDELRSGLEQSLRRLGTDYVDVYHLHGLRLSEHDHAMSALVPEMLKLKDQGKIRAVGVTEAFNADRGHGLLRRTLELDDCWDVVMAGFSVLNQSARERVLTATVQKNIGVLCMFAVRAALSNPLKLKDMVRELIDTGQLARELIDDIDNPLAFVLDSAPSITDAAYRFCRDEPGIHVVLSGTGNIEHLEANVASMQRPPLPAEICARLEQIFHGIDTLSGQ